MSSISSQIVPVADLGSQLGRMQSAPPNYSGTFPLAPQPSGSRTPPHETTKLSPREGQIAMVPRSVRLSAAPASGAATPPEFGSLALAATMPVATYVPTMVAAVPTPVALVRHPGTPPQSMVAPPAADRSLNDILVIRQDLVRVQEQMKDLMSFMHLRGQVQDGPSRAMSGGEAPRAEGVGQHLEERLTELEKLTMNLKNQVVSCVSSSEAQLQALSAKIASEAESHANSFQRLSEELNVERNTRGARVKELADALQEECNQRAGEVEQLANAIQAEREERAAELSEMSANLAPDENRLDDLAEQLAELRQKSATASYAGQDHIVLAGEAGPDIQARLEKMEQRVSTVLASGDRSTNADRINRVVQSEHDARLCEMEQLTRSLKAEVAKQAQAVDGLQSRLAAAGAAGAALAAGVVSASKSNAGFYSVGGSSSVCTLNGTSRHDDNADECLSVESHPLSSVDTGYASSRRPALRRLGKEGLASSTTNDQDVPKPRPRAFPQGSSLRAPIDVPGTPGGHNVVGGLVAPGSPLQMINFGSPGSSTAVEAWGNSQQSPAGPSVPRSRASATSPPPTSGSSVVATPQGFPVVGSPQREARPKAYGSWQGPGAATRQSTPTGRRTMEGVVGRNPPGAPGSPGYVA